MVNVRVKRMFFHFVFISGTRTNSGRVNKAKKKAKEIIKEITTLVSLKKESEMKINQFF